MNDANPRLRIDPRLVEVLGVSAKRIARMGLVELTGLVHDKGLRITSTLRDPGPDEEPGLDLVYGNAQASAGA